MPVWDKNFSNVTKLRVFLVTNNEAQTQDLSSQTITNAILKPLDHMLFLSLTPPTNYILTLIKPFSFV
jgi:hypothetical protein